MKRAFLFFALLVSGLAAEPEPVWQLTAWSGEKAYISSSQGWTAIVLVTRARLIYFGPVGNQVNLLMAPIRRDDPGDWGGHQLWLGPQDAWSASWPPPKEWESSRATSCTIDGKILRLELPDVGSGWPRLTRTYQWDGARLVCGAELQGGQRPAQVMHLLQVSPGGEIDATAQPDKTAPKGYVLLPTGDVSHLQTDFSHPPQVTKKGKKLSLHLHEKPLKPGFRPQPLTVRQDSFTLTVSRGAQSGKVVGEPDLGFLTQVYLGGSHELSVQLDQLSPLFSPDTPAAFAIVLAGGRR